jgi:hypothetical protein
MKIFFLFCFVLLSINAWSEDGLIGRVTKLRGNVVKIHGDNQVILKEGDSLFSGDEIHTQSGSFIKVIMRDDTVFQLGAKSSFKFGEFSFKTKEDRHAVYNLMQGKLRSLFTVPAKEGALKLNTPTASMGIRGTEILSDVYKIDGVLKTDIALLRGKLDVAINEKTFSLKPGEMIESHKFGPKSERAPLPPSAIKEIPRQILTKLELGEKKGGAVFLFDATNGAKKEMEPGLDKAPEFKPEIREKIKLDDVNSFVPPQKDQQRENRNQDRKQIPEGAPVFVPANNESRPIAEKPIDMPTRPPSELPPQNSLPPKTAPPIGGDRPPIQPPPPPPPVKSPDTSVGSGGVVNPVP